MYGVLAGLVIWLLTRGGIMLSPDSINYLSMANAIQKGLWTESLIATWPPFFPISIALCNGLGFHGEQSARIVSIICYSVLVMSIFLLARRSSRPAAHLASFSMLFLGPLLFVYGFCWSETVYVALSALALLILARSTGHSGTGNTVRPALAGLVAGLALLTRYVGVSLLLAGLVILLFPDGKRKVGGRVKDSVVFGGVTCAPVILYLVACSHYRGMLPGYGHHAMPSLWQNIVSFLSTGYHDLLTLDLSFTNPTLFPYEAGHSLGIPIKVLSLTVGLFFLALVASLLLIRQRGAAAKGAAVPAVYVASYSLSFVVITSWWAPIPAATRLCAPIYPFVIVLAFLAIVSVCRSTGRRKARALVCAGSVLAVLCFWCIQAISSANVWKAKKPVETTSVAAEGDITGDGVFDVSDLLLLGNYLFRGGPQPKPLQNANVNCDAAINVGDMLYLVNYIYRNGPPPCNLPNP